MSNGPSRLTKTNLMPCRAALVAALSAILLLVVAPIVGAANTFSDNATPVRLQLKWRHQVRAVAVSGASAGPASRRLLFIFDTRWPGSGDGQPHAARRGDCARLGKVR